MRDTQTRWWWRNKGIGHRTETSESLSGQRRLRCLSRLAVDIRQGESLDVTFRDVVARLPLNWQYSDKACARIVFNGRHYCSDPFLEGPHCLAFPLVADGHECGVVEVFYMDPVSGGQGDPFLKEEAFLLEAAASILSLAVEGRRMRDSLCDAEQKFLAIFNNAVNGVVLVERFSKRCCMANYEFCRLLGYSQEEVPDLSLSDFQPDMSIIDQLYDPLVGQHALREDVPLVRKDRSVIYVDVSSFPIVVGGQEYLLDIFKDVTERHRADSAQRGYGQALALVNTHVCQGLLSARSTLASLSADVADNSDSVGCRETLQGLERQLQEMYHCMQLPEISLSTSEGVNLEQVLAEVQEVRPLATKIQVAMSTPLPGVILERSLMVEVWQDLLEESQARLGEAGGAITIQYGQENEDHWFQLNISGAGVQGGNQCCFASASRTSGMGGLTHRMLRLCRNVILWDGVLECGGQANEGWYCRFSMPSDRICQKEISSVNKL